MFKCELIEDELQNQLFNESISEEEYKQLSSLSKEQYGNDILFNEDFSDYQNYLLDLYESEACDFDYLNSVWLNDTNYYTEAKSPEDAYISAFRYAQKEYKEALDDLKESVSKKRYKDAKPKLEICEIKLKVWQKRLDEIPGKIPPDKIKMLGAMLGVGLAAGAVIYKITKDARKRDEEYENKINTLNATDVKNYNTLLNTRNEKPDQKTLKKLRQDGRKLDFNFAKLHFDRITNSTNDNRTYGEDLEYQQKLQDSLKKNREDKLKIKADIQKEKDKKNRKKIAEAKFLDIHNKITDQINANKKLQEKNAKSANRKIYLSSIAGVSAIGALKAFVFKSKNLDGFKREAQEAIDEEFKRLNEIKKILSK